MIHKVKHGCSFDTPAIPGRTLSTFLDPRITHKTAPAIDRNIGRIHDEIPGGQCPSLLVAMAAQLFSMKSALTSRLTRHVGIAHCYSSKAIAPHIMASPFVPPRTRQDCCVVARMGACILCSVYHETTTILHTSRPVWALSRLFARYFRSCHDDNRYGAEESHYVC